MNITQEQEKIILELKERIEKASSEIDAVNSDNIQFIEFDDDKSPYKPFYPPMQENKYLRKLKEIIKDEKKEYSELVESIMREYDIRVAGAFRYRGFDDRVINLFASKSVSDFIEKLEIYVNALELWRDDEIDVFDETFMTEDFDSIEEANYIVKAYRIAPAWSDGYLEAVVKCETREEAGKVADFIYEKWGDFSVAGANINTEIEEVDSSTVQEIKDEMRADMTRLGEKDHDIDCCEVLDADDVLEDDE